MHLQSAVVSDLTGISSFYSLMDRFRQSVKNLGREMPSHLTLFPQLYWQCLLSLSKGDRKTLLFSIIKIRVLFYQITTWFCTSNQSELC